MPSLPNFTNRYTGETLGNSVEICPACHHNFASTRAGDKHRIWRDGKRVCITPQESGLELSINKHGAIIWRVPRYATIETPTDLPLAEEESLTR